MFRHRHPDLHQEEDDIPWGRVGLALGAMVAVAIALSVWAWTSMEAREAALRPSGVFPEKDLGPRRETSKVEQDLFAETGQGQRLFAEQREALGRFGVVDAERGVVSIPIDVAIDLLVSERGR